MLKQIQIFRENLFENNVQFGGEYIFVLLRCAMADAIRRGC